MYSSIYNFVDLVVFGLPLAGSINQLCIIWGNTPPGGNPALLSFSVLFVFLHFVSSPFSLFLALLDVCHTLYAFVHFANYFFPLLQPSVSLVVRTESEQECLPLCNNHHSNL